VSADGPRPVGTRREGSKGPFEGLCLLNPVCPVFPEPGPVIRGFDDQASPDGQPATLLRVPLLSEDAAPLVNLIRIGDHLGVTDL